MKLVECIPNFSVGTDTSVIKRLTEALESVPNVSLLHVDSGKSANRTVFTYVGELKAVFEATYRAIKLAGELIDMRKHQGEHPRIGACDVCPFVPIDGISLEELVVEVDIFAKKVAKELNLPIFLYESSAKSPNRKNLANHRIGEYEKLEDRINQHIWLPDYGTFNPKSGGTVMGARNFLIAYNINLNTKDATIAREIAYDLRELGRPIYTKNKKTTYKPGLLHHVKAIGWYIKDFDKAQVSINLTNYKATSLYQVFTTTQRIAENYHVKVTGSELIGLIPKEALLKSGELFHPNAKTEEEKISSCINALGLNEIVKFNANERIFEYQLKSR